MEAEEQIIKDIIDSVYGFDFPTEEKDSKKIKQKENERQKKYDDILKQINNLCEKVKKELGLNSCSPEMSTRIRFTVLTVIKSEISNENKVLDSNGKIDIGKFLDIVIQSKNDILGKVENDIDKKEEVPLSNYEQEEAEPVYKPEMESEFIPSEECIDDFFEELEEWNIPLSEEEKEAVKKAKEKVEEFFKKLQEKMDSGMSKEEAEQSIYESMSDEELEELPKQFLLADVAFRVGKKRKENREQATEEMNEKEETHPTLVAETQAPQERPTKEDINPRTMSSENRNPNVPLRTNHTLENTDLLIQYSRSIQEFVSTKNNPSSPKKHAKLSNLEDLGSTGVVLQKVLYSGMMDQYHKEKQSILDIMKDLGIGEDLGENNASDLRHSQTNPLTTGKTTITIENDAHMQSYVSETPMDEYYDKMGEPIDTSQIEVAKAEMERLRMQAPYFFNGLTGNSYIRQERETGEQPIEFALHGRKKKISSFSHSDVPLKPVSTVIPGETAVEEPITPPTEDPAKKLVDVFHPVTPKVQSSPIVAEDVVVGTFEPKTPTPTAEPTVKSTKGNDDASGKGEGNIPLSGFKTFLREVATVRDAAEAAEKLHVNGEKGASKDGTNTQPSTTQTVEESKTEEVPEEPQ